MFFDQADSEICFEWGYSGLQALAPASDVIVIVDVLSFTTCVDLVTANGGYVLPYAGAADTLAEFAAERSAIPAQRRKHNEPAYSLSPASLVSVPKGTRLVLPSPNGSTLSLATQGKPTLAGCLRNARAVAQKASQMGKRISIIAAGERWKDESLRPGMEDLIGAGAIIGYLPGKRRSPEAELAAAGFEHARPNLFENLLHCGSGKELVELGFREDVRLASELNQSFSAPLLTDGMYTNVA